LPELGGELMDIFYISNLIDFAEGVLNTISQIEATEFSVGH